MRRRQQTGGLKKQRGERGEWLGEWWLGDRRVARVCGSVKDVTKDEAEAKLPAFLM